MSGHGGDRVRARSRLADAKRIAVQLGADWNEDDTEFGPTNADLRTVGVAVDLGDAGEALDVHEASMPPLSPERQARLLVDAVVPTHNDDMPAEPLPPSSTPNACPEQVRSHRLARAAVADRLDQFGGRPPDKPLGLARRCAGH